MDIPTRAQRERVSFSASRRRLLGMLGAGLLTGCVPPTYQGRGGPSSQPPSPPPYPGPVARLYLWDSPTLVRVDRAGQTLAASDGMALLANDAVETGYTYVEIDLVVGGRVWLDVNTRVQVGSIFLFLGRLFASGAPPFRVETEDVTASPEGTNFGVRRSRTSGDWAVAVQTGRVRCTGKRLRFQSDVLAGQILVVAGPLTVPPRPALGDLQREIGWATRAMRRQKPLPPIQ